MSPWRILAGLIIVALGVVFTLNNLGLTNVNIAYVIRVYWPLILMALGLLTLFRTRDAGPPAGHIERPLGNLDVGHRDWALSDTDIHSGMGDVRLDLTRARIPSGETVVNISHWMGNVKIFVPRDLAVKARGSVSMGSINLLGQRSDGFFREAGYTSVGYDQAEKRVRFDINLGAGNVSVVGTD